MTKVKKTQLTLIIGAVVLFVLLFFANKKPSVKPAGEVEAQPGNNETIESFVTAAEKVLAPELKRQADDYLNQAKGSEKNKWLDSIVSFWDKNKRSDIASFYFEKKAVALNNAVTWFKAGDRYYYAIRFVKDQNELVPLYQCAMRCYENGLKLEPENAEAKIMLASCYVEGSSDPMKGVSMLREIEKTDSNNVTLQLNFAFFSVKSQQWDKAIRRFEKVLEIDSTYIEAYLHLADAYEQQGKKEKTIEVLEKYKSKTDDVLARQEIEKYIEQLKIK
jgi:tetratricopeptide (TPR) repeat protein